jgi:Domain of unknown function.
VSSDGKTVTISKSFLSTLDQGTANLKFDFDAGADPVLTVTITDTTPVVSAEISPTTATFDLNPKTGRYTCFGYLQRQDAQGYL